MKKDEYLKKAIIRTKELEPGFVSKGAMFRAIHGAVKRGLMVKIKNGLYATVNPITGAIFANRFEIASALFDECVVAYHSALEFYGLGNQMYSEVQAITPKRYMPLDFDGLEYKFYPINLSDGIISIEQNAWLKVTDLERTVVDCIDRIDLSGGIEELYTALSGITYLKSDKLLQYLDGYEKKILFKKAGFLLSSINPSYIDNEFYKICKKEMGSRTDYMIENKALPLMLNKEWNLIIPSTLINMEN